MKLRLSCIVSFLLLLMPTAVGFTQDTSPRDSHDKGKSLLEQGQHAMAIEEFKRAIQIEPWYAEAHMMLGLAYYCRGSFELAAEELENGRALSGMPPYDAWPFATMQILSLLRAGRNEDARERLEQWSNIGGHLERDVKYLSGRWNEKKYLSKRKKERAHGYLVIGANSLVRGDTGKAKRVLQLVADETILRASQWTHRVAEAELAHMDRCGALPCPQQDVEEEWVFSVEEGQAEELRDVRTIYLQVHGPGAEELSYPQSLLETQPRANIIKRLGKYKGVTLLDTLDADVVLVYRAKHFPSAMSEKGWGVAFRLSRNRIRILWQFVDRRTYSSTENPALRSTYSSPEYIWVSFERAPSTNFVRDFVRLHKRLQQEKKK